MWQISFILTPIVVALGLPWVIYVAVTESGVLKSEKFICKCPTIYRVLSIIGVLLFAFLLLMVYLTDEKKCFDFVYAILFVFILIFTILSYICFRYKIVLDLCSEEIIVYKLFAKKHFSFKNIYSLEPKGEIITVSGVDNKKLFNTVILLAGYPILDACLRRIIDNNKRREPVSLEELKEILQRNEKGENELSP